VQLFVISNGTLTKYYSNTTRRQHLDGEPRGAAKRAQDVELLRVHLVVGRRARTGRSRTSPASPDLLRQAHPAQHPHPLLRAHRRPDAAGDAPYQIVATEQILQRIETSTNYKLGTVAAGGYVWHTTGSGKTLTSFKTAQLASRCPNVDKVLFVVDRKDLDYQTMREYDRFQKGAANSNTSTAVLKKQLEDPDARIIITTIQKLARSSPPTRATTIYDGHVVIIFDECHRSQFGDMHTAITKAFKRYHLFGFTGTPIFAANAGTGGNPQLRTTEQAFGDKLHTYTIVDAITDKNVLPFRIDYVNTIKTAGRPRPTSRSPRSTPRRRSSPPSGSAKSSPTSLEHFDQKTKRAPDYTLGQTVRGLQRALRHGVDRGGPRLLQPVRHAAAGPPAGPAAQGRADLQLRRQRSRRRAASSTTRSSRPTGSSADARDFLEDAIQDYNDLFGTSFDTSAEKFQNYYKDLSLRLKNRELDLVIVVNMFLTGFDATTSTRCGSTRTCERTASSRPTRAPTGS
jgi:type I restriction enzyme R subunit